MIHIIDGPKVRFVSPNPEVDWGNQWETVLESVSALTKTVKLVYITMSDRVISVVSRTS